MGGRRGWEEEEGEGGVRVVEKSFPCVPAVASHRMLFLSSNVFQNVWNSLRPSSCCPGDSDKGQRCLSCRVDSSPSLCWNRDHSSEENLQEAGVSSQSSGPVGQWYPGFGTATTDPKFLSS